MDPAAAGSAAYRAGDYAGAERAWRPLAEAGTAAAQYRLGALYYEGRLGGRRDLVAAHAWVARAAAQGYFRAPELLERIEGEMSPDQLAAAGAGTGRQAEPVAGRGESPPPAPRPETPGGSDGQESGDGGGGGFFRFLFPR